MEHVWKHRGKQLLQKMQKTTYQGGILLFFLFILVFLPKDANADGEIVIDSWTKLQNIGYDINFPCNGHYILTKNLTSSDADYATVAGAGAGFESICSAEAFTGSFDGQNYELQNLVVNITGTAGLFGDLAGATIKNLSLVDASITGDDYDVGGLASTATNSTIENVHISGTVTNSDVAYDCTGGMIGKVEASTTILKSSSTADVSGFTSVGGIVGCSNKSSLYERGATVSQTYASGTIIANDNNESNAGGLIGFGYASVIADSYATSDVTGLGESVGGLAGTLITGDYSGTLYDSFIYNSYATGIVTGYDYVGGLVGSFSGSSTEEDPALYDSFSTGHVVATSDSPGAYAGLIGSLLTNVTTSIWNSYWYDGYGYFESFSCYKFGEGGSGNSGCTAVTNLSEFKDEAVLEEIAVAWDFVGSDAVWKTVTNDYPVHFWQSHIDPTPTPTPASPSTSHQTNTTSSSSSNSNSAPICSDRAPAKTPDLFQINATSTSATLFFTPIDEDQFYIAFSTHAHAEEYGEFVTLARQGVQSHHIYFLKPNTTYYVKVRGQNGCMPGNWSNIMQFTTNAQTYYKHSSPKKSTSFAHTPVLGVTTDNLKPSITPPPEYTPTPTLPPNSSNEKSTSPSSSKSLKTCFLWWCW